MSAACGGLAKKDAMDIRQDLWNEANPSSVPPESSSVHYLVLPLVRGLLTLLVMPSMFACPCNCTSSSVSDMRREELFTFPCYVLLVL